MSVIPDKLVGRESAAHPAGRVYSHVKPVYCFRSYRRLSAFIGGC